MAAPASSDISDDYVAPSLDATTAAAAAEEAAAVPLPSSPERKKKGAASAAAEEQPSVAAVTVEGDYDGEEVPVPVLSYSGDATEPKPVTTPASASASAIDATPRKLTISEEAALLTPPASSPLSSVSFGRARSYAKDAVETKLDEAKNAAAMAATLVKETIEQELDVDLEGGGGGGAYVNADNVNNARDAANKGTTTTTTTTNEDDYVEVDDEVDGFDGVMGTVQPPKWKDVKYAGLFLLHLGLMGYMFADTFIPHANSYGGYYSSIDHVGMFAFVFVTGIAGTALAFLTFGYMLRHGQTCIKVIIVLGAAMCAGVGIMGLIIDELFMCVCGLVGFLACAAYMNMVWKRIPFTTIHLSVAITAVRDNMGLFLAALLTVVVGYVWMGILAIASVGAHKYYGNWTVAVSIFSYYWTHQVLTNVLAVATAGTIGRWFVIGEKTPSFTRGLKEIFGRARTYSLGSICFGSLFFGIVEAVKGFSKFLRSKRVPFLPRLIDGILWKVSKPLGLVNEWAYVYIGLYGYSYSAAARNSNELLRNKGWDPVVKNYLATHILFMANLAIGLLTGVCGLLFGIMEYHIMYNSGLVYATSDGFFVGFLVGYFMSSILLSVVSATIHTLVVCLAESPGDFQEMHPALSDKLGGAWDKILMDE